MPHAKVVDEDVRDLVDAPAESLASIMIKLKQHLALWECMSSDRTHDVFYCGCKLI